MKCSAYEINRSPTSTLKSDKTTALLWYARQDISKMRIFGSKVWCIRLPKGSKLEPRAKYGVMIRYCGIGYRVRIPEELITIISRDAIFDESKMYCAKTENTDNIRLERQKQEKQMMKCLMKSRKYKMMKILKLQKEMKKRSNPQGN